MQVRRLVARTLRVALDGGPAHTQLIERWSRADARPASWIAALTWDGVGAAIGWALGALDLRGVAPPDVDALATEAFEEASRRSEDQVAALGRIGVECEATGIPVVALRGAALLLGNVVPSPGIRWTSDVDVLVHERQVEQAAWVLESLDFARATARDPSLPETVRPYHETFIGADGTTVELHWRLGPSRWGAMVAAERWFERAGASSTRGVLLPSAADLFWHFLIHDARNHAWSSGSLRAALDLALVARAPGFTVAEVLRRLEEDPAPEPLVEAIADAANLSPILAAEVEPATEPRYLRLARWRDTIGRRHWRPERASEAIAWGATLDRARRFGGWPSALERALRALPSAPSGSGLLAMVRRAFATARHVGFVGYLAASHLMSIPVKEGHRRLSAPHPASRDTA